MIINIDGLRRTSMLIATDTSTGTRLVMACTASAAAGTAIVTTTPLA
jgi:hypothetical protein